MQPTHAAGLSRNSMNRPGIMDAYRGSGPIANAVREAYYSAE